MPTPIREATERRDAPSLGRLPSGGRPLSRLLELRVRLDDQLTEVVLRGHVPDRTQQRVAAALAVDRVAARRKRHVAAGATAALPHRESDELQSGQRTVGEVDFGFGEFAGGIAFVVRGDLDRHRRAPSASSPFSWTRVVRFLHTQRNRRRVTPEATRLQSPEPLARTGHAFLAQRSWRGRDAEGW